MFRRRRRGKKRKPTLLGKLIKGVLMLVGAGALALTVFLIQGQLKYNKANNDKNNVKKANIDLDGYEGELVRNDYFHKEGSFFTIDSDNVRILQNVYVGSKGKTSTRNMSSVTVREDLAPQKYRDVNFSRFVTSRVIGGVKIKQYTGDEKGTLIIPDEINGKVVKDISKGAFINSEYVESIVLPKSITSISHDQLPKKYIQITMYTGEDTCLSIVSNGKPIEVTLSYNTRKGSGDLAYKIPNPYGKGLDVSMGLGASKDRITKVKGVKPLKQ